MEILKSIRILDLSRLLPGPFCTMILADLGAEVLKVEEPGKGDGLRYYEPIIDGESAWFASINRNKKSITLNLKKKEGKEIFKKLVSICDVLVESFRPGVMEKLGIGYKDLSRINERIIYCSITGYGHKTPYRERAGHDINYVGRSGLLALNKDKNGTPIPFPVQLGDITGGFLAVISILAALFQREHTGKGKFIEIPLFDGLLTWITIYMTEFLTTKRRLNREALLSMGCYPCYNLYPTRDGKYLTLGALEEKFWINLCKALGRDDLVGYQYAKGREKERVKEELKRIFVTKDRDEWIEFFENKEVCVEPVKELEELPEDPHIMEKKLIKEGKYIGLPIIISDEEHSIRNDAPKLGEHNKEILHELGYKEDEIEELRERGII